MIILRSVFQAAVNRVLPQEPQEVLPDAVPLTNHIPASFVEEPMDDSSPIDQPFGPTFNPTYGPTFSPVIPVPASPEIIARETSVIRSPPTRVMDMPDLMPSTSRASLQTYIFKIRYGDSEDTYELPEWLTIGM